MNAGSLLTAAGVALAGIAVVREILVKGVPGTRVRGSGVPAAPQLPAGAAQQARRRFSGLLLAYSFCAGRICRGIV